MSISNSIPRLTIYFRRHGLAATIRRAQLAGKRALFADRMVVLYCDLGERRSPQVNVPTALRVERLRALTDLSAEHLQAMTNFWNPRLADRNIRERFEKGASLWLVECEEQLAGYGWTLQERTIEPYYFPLTQDDVHLFDFYVFPHYRGRGMNLYLIGHILNSFATNCAGRAFIEAAEWNDAMLLSLRKTSFRRLGLARSFTIIGYTFVSWT
jgi:ribosomal protein S18 acetylase RimI-like enzyme